ncbi:MAG: NAD-dependent epimerase/dehydratase family protein [Acetobacteraceae bacterium]
MHHLILGGCGFIGRSVAVLLARAGRTVVLADRVPPAEPIPPELERHISWIDFDLRTADWNRLLDGAGVVHHYAWTSIPASAADDPPADLADNVLPTLHLLQALRRRGATAPRMVFTSSGGTVYGKPLSTPVREDHPLRPITAYGAGKAAAELYIEQFHVLHGLDCRVARLANPFGAGQNPGRGQGAATTFAHRALAGQPIGIWGDGEVVRDYIHISDAAAGLIAMAELPLDGPRTFNIGSGHGTSLNGILAELEARLGQALHVTREPGREFDVPVNILDVQRAKNLLGWAPRLTFTDGMARMLSALEGGKHPYWTVD